MSSLIKTFGYYILLTKPRVMFLVVFSGAACVFLYEGEVSFVDGVLIVVGLYFTGGAANALNQCFERKIDEKMTRTAKKRPLPQKKMTLLQALVFACVLGCVGVLLFFLYFNVLSGVLALSTILFYSVFYTLFLKPNTPQNIVIGGAAGAMPPVIAWAALTNDVWDFVPWILFLIIFLWTPPHFWALALFYKDDYIESGLPMYPVVKGDEATFRAIIVYTYLVVVLSFAPLFVIAGLGWMYVFVSSVCGGLFVKKAFDARKWKTVRSEKQLFFFSIVYLFLIFIALIVDTRFI